MFSPFDDPSYGGGGDIWSTGVFAFESPLKDLLDSNDYTLDDLLEQDELLQELRGLHPQLIDYFGAEEAVAGLVRHIIRPPPGAGGGGAGAGAIGPIASESGDAAAASADPAVLGRPRSLSEAERKQQEEELLEEAQSALMEAPDLHTLKNRGSTDFGDPDFVADVGDQEEDGDDDEAGGGGDDDKGTAGKQQKESYWDEAPSPTASPPPASSGDGDGNGGEGSNEEEKGGWMFDSTKDDDADLHKNRAGDVGAAACAVSLHGVRGSLLRGIQYPGRASCWDGAVGIIGNGSRRHGGGGWSQFSGVAQNRRGGGDGEGW